MKNKKFKEGFTLVEVLIVLGIISILASIAIPSVRGLINRANAVKVVTEMQNVQIAVMNYGIFNPNLSDLTFEKLLSDEYLTSKPENIEIDSTNPLEIKIQYTGDTPSATELKNINNNILIDNNTAYLVVKY
ncbi:prepilin-type N-terminal cleavage/methylation domain-containing protein [Petrotoga olearia]|uniref:N-terminal cleavage protein n=2 Tax=Petrotoga olearia TaxID=156203 RepID=A0A2K1P106_9BACT|nr:prepilin-type N-terminal cleavage/methylation domain-containing protein [Petrotoga olearia]PNR96469.1 N-terminal cleavage protein [Petrotoga olearia DSM 13574]RMA76447.1 prepilin-type N-terminal cleavage/methylation domain-containing protein [Petrotoga olearia]